MQTMSAAALTLQQHCGTLPHNQDQKRLLESQLQIPKNSVGDKPFNPCCALQVEVWNCEAMDALDVQWCHPWSSGFFHTLSSCPLSSMHTHTENTRSETIPVPGGSWELWAAQRSKPSADKFP